MINLILMAGKGSRFKKAGYDISKPLLPINGKAMILHAVESMPKTDSWIFVIRKEHLKEIDLIKSLKKISNNVKIIIDQNPTGQLNSSLVAKKYINNNKPLFIGACDFKMNYDKNKLMNKVLRIKEKREKTIIAFSFTKNKYLSKNPKAWGWLFQNNNRIKEISVKKPISNDPYNDYALTGSFLFSSGKLFLELANLVKEKDIKINNEYYVDSTLKMGLDLKYDVLSHPVDYYGFGTPKQYEDYKKLVKR